MKKLLLIVALIHSLTGFSQTTIYSENFEAGNSFTLNTTDMGGSYAYNTWLKNKSYAGGGGSFTCLGFPFLFTVINTPSQPVGITSAPNSNYMHISAIASMSSGINCASYIPADGTCVLDESNFAKMTADISTLGMSAITLDFWWLCGGSANAYGEVYYSTDGGASWILKQSNLNNVTNWVQTSLTDALWDNQMTLRFGFRFVNTIAASAADPAFSFDEILITSNCSFTNSTITETACDSYISPSGNYVWTTSNTYLDTIPNAANCDSIITINLTINNSSTSTITETVCDSYTSPSGNYVWTISNTYLDTIPNAANCDSIITINLTVNSVSDITTTSSGLTITANNSSASYQWLDCDNNYTIISGEIGQSYTTTANGNYAVELSENGCIDTTSCVAITTVGIIENTFGSEILIYPNPTSGNFSIDLGAVYENADILITGLKGKLIDSKTITQSQTINHSIKEPAGVYIVSIQADDKKAVIRLIKE